MSVSQIRWRTNGNSSHRSGQWAPIAATALAMIGSLYLIFAVDADSDIKPDSKARAPLQSQARGRERASLAVQHFEEIHRAAGTLSEDERSSRGTASRRKVATFLNKMGDVLGSPPRALTEEELAESRAEEFPSLPGDVEALRMENFDRTVQKYSAMRSASRAASCRERSSSSPRRSRSGSPQSPGAALSNQGGTQSTTIAQGTVTEENYAVSLPNQENRARAQSTPTDRGTGAGSRPRATQPSQTRTRSTPIVQSAGTEEQPSAPQSNLDRQSS